MAGVTVYDVLRLAMPMGTLLAAGATGVTHQVTWVATLRATPPVFADVRGGELVVLSIESAQTIDPRLTLDVMLRRLAQAPVAAVAVQGTVSDADLEVADRVALPLLHVPDDADLREVERETKRLITDFEAQLERRGAQLYNTLTQRSLDLHSEHALLQTLVDHTGQSFAAYAPNGDLRLQMAHGQAQLALQSLRPTAAGEQVLLNQQIWIKPISPSENQQSLPSGYVAIAGTRLDDWDRLALQQGAAALALVAAREQAVMAVEERLRGDFLSMVLSGQPGDPVVLLQRGQELGYDVKQPHVAVLVAMDRTASSAVLSRIISSMQSELGRRNIAAPLLRRETSVLCMMPLGSNGTRPRDVADALHDRLRGDYPGVVLALGNPAQSLIEWSRSFKEAEQALVLGQQLFGAERVLAFSDLGVYRLMVLLRESPELWTFYRETLAALVEYDRKQQGELLKTLEAYFNHLGNLRATSEALHVHRNTLLYRLERIEQISGLDLSNAEEHFALWLALRAHRVLRTLEQS
jgi:purine catabolism regulator